MPLKPKPKFDPEKIWNDARRAGHKIHKSEEKIELQLNDEECEKCRYKIVNQSMRLAECTVHNGNVGHGVRLWPIHLWEIRDGRILQKVNGEWKLWKPNFKNNITRFDK